jgi:hypothetical protein
MRPLVLFDPFVQQVHHTICLHLQPERPLAVAFQDLGGLGGRPSRDLLAEDPHQVVGIVEALDLGIV